MEGKKREMPSRIKKKYANSIRVKWENVEKLENYFFWKSEILIKSPSYSYRREIVLTSKGSRRKIIKP